MDLETTTANGILLAGSCEIYNPAPMLYVLSGETITGVRRLYQMQANGSLLFLSIIANDSITKSKFNNLYGCRHSFPDGLMRATDVMNVGKGCVVAMKIVGARVIITKIDPNCALQALMEGIPFLTLEDVAEEQVGKKLEGLNILNSWLNQDSTYKYFEIILPNGKVSTNLCYSTNFMNVVFESPYVDQEGLFFEPLGSGVLGEFGLHKVRGDVFDSYMFWR
ncbi:hypothetical protein SUGI_0387680 [Cryptomeria japonica]|nr:hypothetical protein SUGI_0387680 [Cryptomeria japonica]